MGVGAEEFRMPGRVKTPDYLVGFFKRRDVTAEQLELVELGQTINEVMKTHGT